MTRYALHIGGQSRSFPAGDPFLASASDEAEVTIHLGGGFAPAPEKSAVLVELGTESLAFHAGEDEDEVFVNVVGFARYRNGEDAPSQLVELVRRPWTTDAAVASARAVFEAAGLVVVVSSDQLGRIIDRLVRPKYNAALRLLDEGLATHSDLDLTCRLGLGYPDGPIERVKRGGLAHHCTITGALFETTGAPAYAPPRAAHTARRRTAR